MFQCSMGSFKVHLSFIDSSVSWKSNSHCFLYCYVWVDESPVRKCDDPWDRDVPSLQTVIPLESAAAYDMLDVIREVDLDICFNSCWAEFICESESAHRAGASYQTCIHHHHHAYYESDISEGWHAYNSGALFVVTAMKNVNMQTSWYICRIWLHQYLCSNEKKYSLYHIQL